MKGFFGRGGKHTERLDDYFSDWDAEDDETWDETTPGEASGADAMSEEPEYPDSGELYEEAEYADSEGDFEEAVYADSEEDFGEAEYADSEGDFGEAEHADSEEDFGEAEYADSEGDFGEAEYADSEEDFRDPAQPASGPEETFEEEEYYGPEEALEEAEYYDPEEVVEKAEYYDPEEAPEKAEYYDPEEAVEEAEYYGPEGTFEEEEYYGLEGTFEEAEYSGSEEAYGDPEFAEVPEEDRGFYENMEISYTGDGEEYGADAMQTPDYGEDGFAQEDLERLDCESPRGDENGGEGGLFGKFQAMDVLLALSSCAVLLLAVVMGFQFLRSRTQPVSAVDYASVGVQLENMNLIGEQGINAVVSAELNKLAEALPEPVETQTPEPDTDYQENEYVNHVTVKVSTTSVLKDLKIKFTNDETGKLIANVPFSVTVTRPDGGTESWTDSDMDGIIYKKNIDGGSYQLALDQLTDAKYARYTIRTDVRTVDVKKELDYQKVDVSDEVKKESEVNVAAEDTHIEETEVESVLQDTVTWVESTAVSDSYIEISKSSIPNPESIKTAAVFRAVPDLYRVIEAPYALTQSGGEPSPEPEPSATPGSTASPEPTAEPEPSPTPEPTAEPEPSATPGSTASPEPTEEPDPSPTPEPTAEPTPSASPEPSATPSASPAPSASPSPTPAATPSASPSPTPTVTPGVYKADVTPTSHTLTVGESFTAAVSSDNVKISSVTWSSSDTSIATVTGNGQTATVKAVAAGEATIRFTAEGKTADGDKTVTGLEGTCKVTVTGALELKLDVDKAEIYAEQAYKLTATLTNAKKDAVVKASSSDSEVATVSVDKSVVTVTGLKEGTCTVTVQYEENGNTVKATCEVTVKIHPKNDKSTKLKDDSGVQVFVQEDGKYREAVVADYFTAQKFFVRGETRYTGWQTIDGRVYFFDASGKKVTGEQVIQGATYTFGSDGSLTTGNGTMGIDVSKWNGAIDWDAVKNSGVSYVIIRCGYRGSSQGALIIDPRFETNIRGAAAAGLKVGVYFFTQAIDEVEAVYEASFVLEMIKNYKLTYPVFLDVEASGGRGDKIDRATRTAVCKAFCKTIQDAGYTAGIYANKNWLTEKIDAGALGAYRIWLAQYAVAPTYSGRYDIWQYKDTGRVSGIEGNVDLNMSFLGY